MNATDTAVASAGTATVTPKRRELNGTKEELPGGGWFRLRARQGNLDYIEKMRRLDAEIREQHGLAVDDNLAAKIGPREYVAFLVRVQIGTVVTEWGDFLLDGVLLPCRTESGALDEQACIQILSQPEISSEFAAVMETVDGRLRRNVQVAEKTSPPLSIGNSDTESTSRPTLA